MQGFSHIKTNGVHFFTHKELEFTLKLLPNSQSAFCLTSGNGKVVWAPKPAISLLGSNYQPDNASLGYHNEYYSNAAHELIHIIYSWLTARKLSPNHRMLMGLGDIPIPQADNEEVIVTGLQIFANTGFLPERTRQAIMQDCPDANVTQLAYDVAEFHLWVMERCHS